MRTTRLLRVALLLVCMLPVLRAAEIPKGTHILLRLENSLTTRTARVGDRVYLRTGSPVILEDRIAVPVNSYVQGEVASVKRAGRVSGRAELGIRLDTLTLPSGRTFHFSSTLGSVESEGTAQQVSQSEGTVQQGSERGRDAGRVLIWAGQGAALGAIVDRTVRGAGIGAGAGGAVGLATVMLSRGRDVELRRSSTLDVVFQRPLSLE